jgi:ribonuclease Y
MDTIALVATVVVAALVAGVFAGFLARGVIASQAIQSAQDKAARIVAEARTQQKELILTAKDEKLRLQREAEDEARAKRGELSGLESRLLARDEQLDMRADMLEQRDRKLLEREREFETERQELARAHQEHVAALERVSGMSASDAKAQLLEAVRDEADRDAIKLAKAIEHAAREEAEERAR